MVYVKYIKNYNTEVLQNGIRPNLAETLSVGAEAFENKSIKDLWALVRCITEVPVSLSSDVVKARSDPSVQAALVKQARHHLEKSYETHMHSLVYSQLERAQLGGVPGMLSLVRAYLKVVLPPQALTHLEDGTDYNNAPVWPLIFFCLRAGGVKAAASAASDNNNPAVVEVAAALKQLEKISDGRRLSSDTEKKLRLAYKRCSKSITDPFKRAVYCVLARCDPMEDHCDIITTTDDYLWIKLAVVDCDSTSGSDASSSSQDELTLAQFQKMLYQDYGESHFDAWNQPLLYVSVSISN